MEEHNTERRLDWGWLYASYVLCLLPKSILCTILWCAYWHSETSEITCWTGWDRVSFFFFSLSLLLYYLCALTPPSDYSIESTVAQPICLNRHWTHFLKRTRQGIHDKLPWRICHKVHQGISKILILTRCRETSSPRQSHLRNSKFWKWQITHANGGVCVCTIVSGFVASLVRCCWFLQSILDIGLWYLWVWHLVQSENCSPVCEAAQHHYAIGRHRREHDEAHGASRTFVRSISYCLDVGLRCARRRNDGNRHLIPWYWQPRSRCNTS